MTNEIELFIRLKYPIITEDRDFWNLVERYPSEVTDKWFRRMFEELEITMSSEEKYAWEMVKAGEIIENSIIFSTEDSTNVHWLKYVWANPAYRRTAGCFGVIKSDLDIHYSNLGQLPSTNQSRNIDETIKRIVPWLIEELYEYESKIE